MYTGKRYLKRIWEDLTEDELTQEDPLRQDDPLPLAPLIRRMYKRDKTKPVAVSSIEEGSTICSSKISLIAIKTPKKSQDLLASKSS